MYGYSFSIFFVEKREIRGTDYAQGHAYDDIYDGDSAKWRLLC